VPLDDRLRAAVGNRQTVIVGIRPDDFEDADLISDDRRGSGVLFDANVDVTEWLGEVLYAYVPYHLDESVRAQLDELDRELEGEGMRSQLVVALDAMSPIRDGDTAQLWIDPAKIHLFDAESGDNLTRDEEKAAKLEEDAKRQRERALERAKQRAEREGAPATA
jgi:multiple sugar transport system ATP-binding protein